MVAEEQKKTAPAAYLPFKTFLSSLETLEHGLPKKLDRSIWRQSGIVQGQIMMAYRFFGLITENDEPTNKLQLLVEDKSKRPQYIGTVVREAYSDLIAHDLTKMTPKMLEEAMGAYNVQGDTRRKAIAFFLRAAKYAEMPMHPLLTSQTRNPSNGVRKKKKVKESIVDSIPAAVIYPPANGSSSESVTLENGGTVTLHLAVDLVRLHGKDRTFVFDLIDKIQAYKDAFTVKGSKEEEDE